MSQANQTNIKGSTSKVDVSSDSSSTHPIADKIKDTLQHSADVLSEKAAAAEDGIRESATKGSQSAESRRKQIESEWEHSSVKQYAIENPVKTAGLAFAAGMLIASIFKK